MLDGVIRGTAAAIDVDVWDCAGASADGRSLNPVEDAGLVATFWRRGDQIVLLGRRLKGVVVF